MGVLDGASIHSIHPQFESVCLGLSISHSVSDSMLISMKTIET